MKDKISRFKELWAVPKYKIYIKFVLWLIFFIFVFIFIVVGRSVSENNVVNDIPKEPKTVNFSKMKKNLSSNSLIIKYNIGNYYIEGNVDNNILNGTLELEDSIFKIKYDNSKLYQVKLREEIEDNELLIDVNKDYLLPSNVIKIIDEISDSPIKSEDNKVYSYNINDLALSIYLSDTEIEKIIILENNITYELNYEKIGDTNG